MIKSVLGSPFLITNSQQHGKGASREKGTNPSPRQAKQAQKARIQDQNRDNQTEAHENRENLQAQEKNDE